MGGEKSVEVTSQEWGLGSPPRGRGKARFICAIVQNLRIIPA